MFDVLVTKDGQSSQVKIFKTPRYSYYYKDPINNTGICFNGGLLKIFYQDEDVPYKGVGYNYGKEFMVILNNLEFTDNWMVALFNDGKFRDICTKEKFKKISAIQMRNVYDYYGDKLKINSMQMLQEYLNDTFRMRNIYWNDEETIGDWNWRLIREKWNLLMKREHKIEALKDCLKFYMIILENNNTFLGKKYYKNNIKFIKEELTELQKLN